MKTYAVVFRPRARKDLFSIYRYISEHATAEIAWNYMQRIQEWCLSLSTIPERGTVVPGNVPGLRLIGFEHRVSILFRVEENSVRVLRVLYGGRDLEAALKRSIKL